MLWGDRRKKIEHLHCSHGGKISKQTSIYIQTKVVSAVQSLGLTGFVQNRPDGRILLIAEGERDGLERLASAIDIKDPLIDVHKIESEFSEASGAYPTFRKLTGPDEVGERLDDGIEILKELVAGVGQLPPILPN